MPKINYTNAARAGSIYAAIAIMTAIAVAWLGFEFWRLLSQPSPPGAFDLRLRYEETKAFFKGVQIYDEIGTAVYPPASYLMFWPLMGWLSSLTAARQFWALTTTVALVILSYQVIQVSKANRLRLKILWVLLPLSTYAVGATIGNGGLGVHILPCLIGCMAIADSKQDSLLKDSFAGLLIFIAQIKPTVSAPFFWILLFKKPRSASICGFTYFLFTITAPIFQPEYNPLSLFSRWLGVAKSAAAYGATKGHTADRIIDFTDSAANVITHINAHSILSIYGFSEWNRIASIVILIILGVWIFRNRKGDVWILAGVAAIVSKFWTYHFWYDDLILIFTSLALFRIGQQEKLSTHKRNIAKVFFWILLLFTLAPGGTHILPAPFNSIYLILQSLLLILILPFLAKNAKVVT